MPQNFMYDHSVPARWRLLGIINGFAINGNQFYATNAWIMEELKCSEMTVSTAIRELEELGEITIERHGNSRIITRVKANLGKGKSQLGSRVKANLGKGKSQLLHNSDNIIQIDNSDNIKEAKDEPLPSNSIKVNEIIKAFEVVDPKNSEYYKNKSQRSAADFLIRTYGYDRTLQVVAGLPTTNKIQFVPFISTPCQLRDNWSKLEAAAIKFKTQKKAQENKYKIAFT